MPGHAGRSATIRRGAGSWRSTAPGCTISSGAPGPPVVLLHGNVVSAEDYVWSGVLDRVAERDHRVVAFDRPGFGYSDRPHGTLWTPAAQADLLRRPSPGSASSARWSSAIPGARWWPWRWRSTIRRRSAASSCCRATTSRRRARRAAGGPAGHPGARRRAALHGLAAAWARDAAAQPQGHVRAATVPDRFRRDFPYGFPVRPWQIRAEAQDAATMVPAVAALAARATSELQLPVTIMAGTEGPDRRRRRPCSWFHDASRQRAPAGPRYGAHVPLRGARAGRRGHHGDGEQAADDQRIGPCEHALCRRTRTPAGGVIASWAAIG